MPTYEAECNKCGTQQEFFSKIAEREASLPICCGEQTSQIITRACFGIVQADIAYESPVTGKHITTRAARREDMKRTRSRPWEGIEQELKESNRKKQYQAQKEDAQIEDSARRAWHQLPPSKRAVLDGSD